MNADNARRNIRPFPSSFVTFSSLEARKSGRGYVSQFAWSVVFPRRLVSPYRALRSGGQDWPQASAEAARSGLDACEYGLALDWVLGIVLPGPGSFHGLLASRNMALERSAPLV